MEDRRSRRGVKGTTREVEEIVAVDEGGEEDESEDGVEEVSETAFLTERRRRR